jgi:type VI secretion system protein
MAANQTLASPDGERYKAAMAGGFLTRLKRRSQGRADLPTVASIVLHLQGLLNTRQGSSALDPKYGLPDFTDVFHTFPRGTNSLCDGIARAIERYESRLKNVEVEAQPVERGQAFLRFVIRAELADSGAPVQFDSTMTSNGQVTLK